MGKTYIINLPPVSVGKRTIKTRRMPPSLNARMHWAERAKWTDEWKESVGWELLASKVPKKMGKIRIDIFNHACQVCDEDNMYSSMKPIIDAIVLGGIIEDDSPEFLKLQYHPVKVNHKKDEKFILHITSLCQ